VSPEGLTGACRLPSHHCQFDALQGVVRGQTWRCRCGRCGPCEDRKHPAPPKSTCQPSAAPIATAWRPHRSRLSPSRPAYTGRKRRFTVGLVLKDTPLRVHSTPPQHVRLRPHPSRWPAGLVLAALEAVAAPHDATDAAPPARRRRALGSPATAARGRPAAQRVLGGQLKRRRPVRLCSLEVQAHPVTRQDLDPPLRE
jgi:hypothetical protein